MTRVARLEEQAITAADDEVSLLIGKPYLLAFKRRLLYYYQLTKPERTLTNVLSAGAGYAFASNWHVGWRPLLALLFGSSLIIASACVYNNLIDRRLDQKMVRTRRRALVTGQVSASGAATFAGVLGVTGFWLLLYTNWLTFTIGAIAFVGYVVVYDFVKRHSVHGTLVGTIPGGASLVAGYTAATGRFGTTALLLFAVMVAWQMAHFFAIAIYRFNDYKTAGVPVWPVRYGLRNTKFQILGYIVAFTAACGLLATVGAAGYIFLFVMAGVGVYWFWRGWQGVASEIDDAKWARGMFGLSLVVILIFCSSLALSPVLP